MDWDHQLVAWLGVTHSAHEEIVLATLETTPVASEGTAAQNTVDHDVLVHGVQLLLNAVLLHDAAVKVLGGIGTAGLLEMAGSASWS